MLPNRKTENKAVKVALNYIKARPRSSWEVAGRLQRAGFTSVETNSVIEQLTKVDILNDARFAKDWVRWRDRTKPSGEYLLKNELRDKGLTDEMVAQMLEHRNTPEWFDEVGLPYSGEALDVVLVRNMVKNFVTKKDLSDKKEQAKLAAKLTRRGFSSALVFTAIYNWQKI